jgi:O-antigen/teichoic acid export membrane protein
VRKALDLVASLGDAGAASAGTLLVGLIALRSLSNAELALYALLFSAGVAAMVIPQQMSYLPRRIRVNQAVDKVRSAYQSDLISSLPFIIVAVLIVLAAGLPLYAAVGALDSLLLSGTAILWVTASSFQDHIRTSLHITDDHRLATVVSFAQLTIVAICFASTLFIGPDYMGSVTTAIPFGTLAVANILSAGVGMWLHRKRNVIADSSRIALSLGLRTAASGFMLQVSGYASNLIITLTLGYAALATLEGARIAAQPILVAGAALSSYFLPTAIRMQQRGEARAAGRRIGTLLSSQIAIGIIYAAIVPFLAVLLGVLADRPIDAGVAAALAIAFALQVGVGPLNQMNIAAGRYRLAAMSTAISIAGSIVVLLITIPFAGVYAVPISISVGALVRASVLVGQRRGRK